MTGGLLRPRLRRGLEPQDLLLAVFSSSHSLYAEDTNLASSTFAQVWRECRSQDGQQSCVELLWRNSEPRKDLVVAGSEWYPSDCVLDHLSVVS